MRCDVMLWNAMQCNARGVDVMYYGWCFVMRWDVLWWHALQCNETRCVLMLRCIMGDALWYVWCDFMWHDVSCMSWNVCFNVMYSDLSRCMWCYVMSCGVMWCEVMWCDVMYVMMWCCAMQCDVCWYDVIWMMYYGWCFVICMMLLYVAWCVMYVMKCVF